MDREQIKKANNRVKRIIATSKKSNKQIRIIRLVAAASAVLAVAVIIVFIINLNNDNAASYSGNTELNDTNNPPTENGVRKIYAMNLQEDTLSEIVPEKGDVHLSGGVKSFTELNLSEDYYIITKIKLYYYGQISVVEFCFEGKTVLEWKNDPFAKQYDDYLGDEFGAYYNNLNNQDELNGQDLHILYRQYLESKQDEDGTIGQIIAAYDNYERAEKASSDNCIKKEIDKYSEECSRLISNGITASVLNDDGSVYIICELNKDDITTFPAGDFGYIISLCTDDDPICE